MPLPLRKAGGKADRRDEGAAGLPTTCRRPSVLHLRRAQFLVIYLPLLLLITLRHAITIDYASQRHSPLNSLLNNLHDLLYTPARQRITRMSANKTITFSGKGQPGNLLDPHNWVGNTAPGVDDTALITM